MPLAFARDESAATNMNARMTVVFRMLFRLPPYLRTAFPGVFHSSFLRLRSLATETPRLRCADLLRKKRVVRFSRERNSARGQTFLGAESVHEDQRGKCGEFVCL
jgi:hypothetical protein